MAVSTSFLLLFANWKDTRRRHLFTHFLMVPPNLKTLCTSVSKIREALNGGFGRELDKALPNVEKEMADVYLRLTDQKSFTLVHVNRGILTPRGPELTLVVGSEQNPGHWYDPEQVLNGQSKSAVRLLPYFVFSSQEDFHRPLDFLLVDDPSESFDTGHIGLLLDLLYESTAHAQLMVATHEESEFLPLIKQRYETDKVNILKVESFDAKTGPTITCTRIW
jgi:hypothetical protein